MTRRWSLIALIAALTVALAFVVVDLVEDPKSEKKAAHDNRPSAGETKKRPPLEGVGWWPAHDGAKDRAGTHDAELKGETSWTEGPNGGALQLDGSTGYADTGAPVIDTGKDYSVAARVRLDEKGKKIQTAVSQDGEKTGVFYLQYSAPDKRFAFSAIGARAFSRELEEPEEDRWYHLVGTYSSSEKLLKLYVNGEPAGVAQVAKPAAPAGNLVIGRARFRGRPSDFWNGAIADVHAYDRVLDVGETASLAAHEPG